MKKKYLTPEFDIETFSTEDILTISGATSAQDGFAEFDSDAFK